MATTFKTVSDNAQAKIATTGELNNTTSPLTLNVETGKGSLFPASGTFYVTIWDNDSFADPFEDPQMEKGTATISGDAITLTRTDPKTHTGTPTIANLARAAQITDIHSAINTLENNNTGTNSGDQDLSGYATTTALTTGLAGKSDTTHNHDSVYAPVLGADDNYVTDAEKTKLSNLSGVNSGDQTLNGLLPTQTGNDGKVLQTNGTNSSWVAASSVAWIVGETPTGLVNSSNTAFTTAQAPVTGSVIVYQNGARMSVTEDYTISGSTITFSTAPVTGDIIRVDYLISTGTFATGSVSRVYNEAVNETPNGVLTAFTIDFTPVANTLAVYVDGQLQSPTTDYTVDTSTKTITFAVAPVTGSDVRVHYDYAPSSAGNADTVDGFNASTIPTVGNVPVLDSALAMITPDLSRQAVMNGNFNIWQRGVTVALADATQAFLADRWYDMLSKDGGTLPTLTRSRQTLTSGDIPNSFYYSRLVTNGAGTSLGAGSYHNYVNKIEHGNRLLCGLNKKVTLSFWARSDIANKRLGVYLQQSYGTGGSPSSAENLIGTNWTLTSTWTKYTYTFTTNTLVGKTFGTAFDDRLTIIFSLMWGATAQNDLVGATTAETYVGAGYVDLAQVQLCSGDVALPFQPKSYSQELIECQRFCRRYTSEDNVLTRFATGFVSTTTAAEVLLPFTTQMRANPTVTVSAAADFLAINNAGSGVAVTVLADNRSTRNNIDLAITVATGLTGGNATCLVSNSKTTAWIQAEAEI